MYKKPTGASILISLLIWGIIGALIGAGLGLFLGPGGLIVGPILGLLLGMAQAGRNVEEKEKKYEETQKLVMQKIQTGVPLTKEEKELWDSMNHVEQPEDRLKKEVQELLAAKRVDEFGPVPKHCFSKFNRLRSKHLLWLEMADNLEPGKRKEKYLRKAQSYIEKARKIDKRRKGNRNV